MSVRNAEAERNLFLMVGSGLGVSAFFLHGLLADLPAVPKYEPPHYDPAPASAAAAAPSGVEGAGEAPAPQGGEALYGAKCAACHQANGAGLPGAFPPLAGSSWLVEDPETPIRIALLGLSGPIEVNGQKFDSAMPGLGLNDQEIADILSYVRSAWGNQASAVTPEMVAEVRSSLAGRTDPWDAETLKSLRNAE